MTPTLIRSTCLCLAFIAPISVAGRAAAQVPGAPPAAPPGPSPREILDAATRARD